MKVQSYGFEMIQWRVNNDQILTFGWTSNAFNVSWETISYDGTVLRTCPYCAQMCAQPLSIVMNERSAKDEARWKNKRSTHGNIYPHSHQLNICLTLSYLYRNHSHNTEYSIYIRYDMTYPLRNMLILPQFPYLKCLCLIWGERTIWMWCARKARAERCAHALNGLKQSPAHFSKVK